MGFFDDMKAKADTNGDGKVDWQDVQDLAKKHGMEDKVEDAKGTIAGPDGKVSLDDAQRLFGDAQKNVANGFNDLKDKFSGK